MNGMDALTGKPLDGTAHLNQSVTDILSTPIGTRIARREYGSLLFELLDQPMNALGRMRLIAATALALARWEPRIRVTNVAMAFASPASVTMTIDAVRLDAPTPNERTRLLVPLSRRSIA